MDLRTIQDPKYNGFSFGVQPKLLAAELRRLADDIDSGIVAPSDVRLIQRATMEDFYQHSLIIRFAEQIRPVSDPPPIPG